MRIQLSRQQAMVRGKKASRHWSQQVRGADLGFTGRKKREAFQALGLPSVSEAVHFLVISFQAVLEKRTGGEKEPWQGGQPQQGSTPQPTAPRVPPATVQLTEG